MSIVDGSHFELTIHKEIEAGLLHFELPFLGLSSIDVISSDPYESSSSQIRRCHSIYNLPVVA